MYNIYFLRARALAMLNRIPHALKDCGRAHYVKYSAELGYDVVRDRQKQLDEEVERREYKLRVAKTRKLADPAEYQAIAEEAEPAPGKRKLEKPMKGAGALYYFMARLYAHLRMYAKAHHLSRDALQSGVPFHAVHRVHYFQGLCLCYAGRLEEAVKAFSMALKSDFAARCAARMREIESFRTGLIQLPTVEEVAIFAEKYPKFLDELGVKLPKLQKFEQKRNEVFEVAFRQDGNFQNQGDLFRIRREPCVPDVWEKDERDQVQRIQKYSDLKRQLIGKQYETSKLNLLQNRVQVFDDFLLLNNKDVQTIESVQSQLYIILSNPHVWLTRDNCFYLHERAKCLQELGQLEQACDDFTAIIRLQRENPRLYFRRGFALKNLGMFEQAALDFKKAQSLDSANEHFKLDLGSLGNIGYIEVVPHGHEEFYCSVKDWKQHQLMTNDEYNLNKMYHEVRQPIFRLADLEFQSMQEQQLFDLFSLVGEAQPEDSTNNSQLIDADTVQIDHQMRLEADEAEEDVV